MSIQNKTKKTLKARDIERLENTSFASALIGGAPDIVDGTAAAEGSPICTGATCEANSCVCSASCDSCICSMSCETACSCACISVACCNTHTLTCNVLENIANIEIQNQE